MFNKFICHLFWDLLTPQFLVYFDAEKRFRNKVIVVEWQKYDFYEVKIAVFLK